MIRIREVIRIITYMCIAIAYLAVSSYTNVYYSIAFFVSVVFGVYSDYYRAIRVPRAALNILSLLVLMISFVRISQDFLVEPVLDALIILVGIKLLEDKKVRDYMQIYTMCMFLLIGSCLISLSIAFLIYFSLLVLLITGSLLLLTYFSHDAEMVVPKEQILKISRHSILITSISIPTSFVFFIILPRTNFPILSFLNKTSHATSGFGDKVVLGEVSEIQEDNGAIFRAEMERVDEEKLYWRGIVLDKFDGSSWSSSEKYGMEVRVPIHGQKIHQTIYLEPYGNKYLFALERPVSISLMKASYLKRMEYSFGERVYERIRYRAVSVASESLHEDRVDRAHYLQLPNGFSPGIEDLVKGLAGAKEELEKIKILTHFVKRGDYNYSMVNLPVSKAPLEDFLLVTKQGNCEYFASSLAVMLRMAGIPARLIGGYKGGYYNNTGKYYLVLQKNAHVWVEAHTLSHGWTRLDPTPDTFESPSLALQRSAFLQLRLLMDTFNYYWYRLIINYDFSKQVMILDKIRSTLRKPDFGVFKKALPEIGARRLVALPVLSLLAAWLVYRILSSRQSPGRRLISRFYKRMSRYGYVKGRGEGLEEFVARIEARDLRIRASQFIQDFQRIYYLDREFTKQELRKLYGLINEISWKKACRAPAVMVEK